jgi:hypothetical protein
MLTLILKDESIYSVTKNSFVGMNDDVIVFTINEPTHSTMITKNKTVMLDLSFVSSLQIDENDAITITDYNALKNTILEYFSK